MTGIVEEVGGVVFRKVRDFVLDRRLVRFKVPIAKVGRYLPWKVIQRKEGVRERRREGSKEGWRGVKTHIQISMELMCSNPGPGREGSVLVIPVALALPNEVSTVPIPPPQGLSVYRGTCPRHAEKNLNVPHPSSLIISYNSQPLVYISHSIG